MEVLEVPINTGRREEREKIFTDLYEIAFPPVARFVSKMNGSFQDAKDIFHDALVIYYEKSADPQFIITVSAEAYIVGIAKHLWSRKFKQDHKNVSLESVGSAYGIPEDYFAGVNSKRVLQFLEKTGKKCLDLLRAFYYEKLPMKDVVHALHYRNEHSATVQKYKCLEKVRNTIKEKSITYDDFIE